MEQGKFSGRLQFTLGDPDDPSTLGVMVSIVPASGEIKPPDVDTIRLLGNTLQRCWRSLAQQCRRAFASNRPLDLQVDMREGWRVQIQSPRNAGTYGELGEFFRALGAGLTECPYGLYLQSQRPTVLPELADVPAGA